MRILPSEENDFAFLCRYDTNGPMYLKATPFHAVYKAGTKKERGEKEVSLTACFSRLPPSLRWEKQRKKLFRNQILSGRKETGEGRGELSK